MKVRDNVLISINDNDIKNNNFIIPKNINIINSRVFKNKLSLNQIIFHEKIKEIRRDACSYIGIRNLYIPEGVEVIGDYAFASTNIRSIIIPEQIKIIRNATFHNCKKFVELALPDNL